MPHVAFIAPRFLENTLHYVRAFAALDGVTLSLISEDPEAGIPADLRARVAGHYRVTQSLDAAQLIAAVRALQRGVAPVDRLTGALEQLQLPMAEARDATGVEGMSAEVARNFRDKDRMKQVLRAHGVPVAQSALVHSVAELRAFTAEVGLPIIVKPPAGLGARNTHRITSPEELEALSAAGMAPSAAQPLQAEEFVRAREHTCETVTIKGEVVWRSGTRYFPTPLEVLETPWVQYCVLLQREEDAPEFRNFDAINGAALRALLGDSAATAAGTALSHMEWFLRPDGSSLVNEVGARPPGALIMPLNSIAHECNFFAEWARLIALDQFTPRPRRWAAGAAFLRGQGSGDRIVSVRGLDEAIAKLGDALIEMRTPKVGQPRATGYEGEGWATVRAATTEEAKRALLTLIEGVQIRYG
jgi:Carbamoyl-phosphate synthase L chain, ATP binding domain